MKDNSDLFGQALFIGCCIGALIFIVANGLSCLPDRCEPFWMGQKGYAEILISLGTLVAAVLAGWLAWRSYKLNLSAGRATRFSKAAEMAASDSSATATAGVAILEDLGGEDPQYLVQSVRTLAAVIRDRDHEFKKVCQPFITSAERYEGPWPLSEQLSSTALTSITRLLDTIPDYEPIEIITDKGQPVIEELYVTGRFFDNHNFYRYKFHKCYMHLVTFRNCIFVEATIHAATYTGLRFENCDFTGANLKIANRFGTPFDPFHFTSNVTFEGCVLNGVKVWDEQPKSRV